MNVIAIRPGMSSTFSPGTLRGRNSLNLPDSTSPDADWDITAPTDTFIARGLLFGLAISVPLWAIIVGAAFLVYWIMT